MKKVKFTCMLLLAMLLMPLQAIASSNTLLAEADSGVVFVEKPIAEVLQMGRQSGKLIFVDCYTSWCVPCKKMVTTTFVLKSVGDYMNANFVSTKIDMEKGEGPQLAKQWDINAYPTFLILDADGKIVCRLTGYSQGEPFIESLKTELSGKNKPDFVKSYEFGVRSKEVVSQYVNYLAERREARTISTVVEEYLSANKSTIASDSLSWSLFSKYINDVKSPVFLYVHEHADEVVKYQGEKAAETIGYKWKTHVKSFYGHKDGEGESSMTWDDAKATEYEKYMNEHNVKEAHDYILAYKLPYAMITKTMPLLVEVLDDAANCSLISDSQYNYAVSVARKQIGDDAAMTKRLDKIVEKRNKLK